MNIAEEIIRIANDIVADNSLNKKPVYQYTMECEHEGDVRDMYDEIGVYDGLCEIVDEDKPNNWNHDYYVTLYFTVSDKERFENETGMELDHFQIAYWK